MAAISSIGSGQWANARQMKPMTPSAKELADGQKACERIEAFQRCSKPFDTASFCLIVGAVTSWNTFQKDGWKVALFSGVFWFSIGAISIYQYKKMQRQTDRDVVLLKQLKDKYGAIVYSEMQKKPHSLYYRIFQKRYPPFNRQSVKLP